MKILITGASSGIGYLTGITLASRNHEVYMTTHTNKQLEMLKKKLNEIKIANLKIKTFKLDITSEKDRKKIEKLDLDVLYCHAGIGIGGSVLKTDIIKIIDNFEVNVFSNIELVREYIEYRTKKNKGGKVVVMSSLISKFTVPWLGIYSSTKASLSALIKALQKEIKYQNPNMKIVLIEPGAYHTGFNQKMIAEIEDDEMNLKTNRNFRLIEKRSTRSIVSKIIIAIEEKKPKKVYRAPRIQCICSKIYNLFC